MLTAWPALDAAELAELWTLESPSDAFDCAFDAASFTVLVASAVVEALRMPARRTVNVDCRNTARDAARDILMRIERGKMGCRRSSAREGGWSSGSELTIFPRGPCAACRNPQRLRRLIECSSLHHPTLLIYCIFNTSVSRADQMQPNLCVRNAVTVESRINAIIDGT